MGYYSRYSFMFLVLFSCSDPGKIPGDTTIRQDTLAKMAHYASPPFITNSEGYVTSIITANITPMEVTAFAQSLEGTPYKYGSTDPTQGFDCSGFITYVFNHFGLNVPRSSIDFTDMQQSIDIKDAKSGDLILFTGTDTTVRVAGHMGILLVIPGKEIQFIHSTSGKAKGVTETPLNAYYMARYIKTIRVFNQNKLLLGH
jgi:hypothetical protein